MRNYINHIPNVNSTLKPICRGREWVSATMFNTRVYV